MNNFRNKFGLRLVLTGLMFGLLLFGSSTVALAQNFTVTNLVADQTGVAANTDANLVGPVGLARGIDGPWWVANKGTATSTLYDGSGIAPGLVVSLPPAPGSPTPAKATGTIFSLGVPGLNVSPGNPALFMFVTLEGTILGWNPNVNVFNAVVMLDRHGRASYTGVTTAPIGNTDHLYVVNALTESVDVFDVNLGNVSLHDDAFRDPLLPEGLVPFNVHNIGQDVVVTYHRRHEHDSDDPAGWVAIFDPRGRFLSRLQPGPWMDAPWGVALAPHDYGEFTHMFLVANHGSGKIAAFDPFTGDFKGFMLDPNGNVISIDGIWALEFGNGGIADFTASEANGGPATGPYNMCYFTAGPQMGQHGLFGNILPVDSEQDRTRE